MGAPVSKPGNIKSDNIAETLFESSTHGSDTEVETDVHNNVCIIAFYSFMIKMRY